MQLDLFSAMEQEIAQQNKEVLPAVADGKLYFTITEVGNMFNVNASLLRFWEKEFPQFKLRKNGKGDRLYKKEDIELVGTIYYLTKQRKFTLQGTREYLQGNKKRATTEGELMAELQTVKNFLQQLKAELNKA